MKYTQVSGFRSFYETLMMSSSTSRTGFKYSSYDAFVDSAAAINVTSFDVQQPQCIYHAFSWEKVFMIAHHPDVCDIFISLHQSKQQ